MLQKGSKIKSAKINIFNGISLKLYTLEVYSLYSSYTNTTHIPSHLISLLNRYFQTTNPFLFFSGEHSPCNEAVTRTSKGPVGERLKQYSKNTSISIWKDSL